MSFSCQEIIALDEVDSTSAHLKRLVAEGCPVGTVVTARVQTAGYGQRGRTWVSDPGQGLFMSVLLPIYHTPTQLPFVLGLGCLDGLAAFAPDVRLKWVNDLVARRRKLGGMLVELVKGQACAGVGVNLVAPAALPEAIGLAELCATPPTLESLRDALLAGIAARLATWQSHGFDPLRADWSAHSATLGQAVRVLGSEPEAAGVAEALGPAGELLLRLADGTLHPVITGTVRAADGSYC